VAEPDSPTGAAAATPKLLSDSQVQSFIENGFLSIPVTELSQEWHARYAARASEWTFQGLHEPQVGRHSTHLSETTELCRSATMTGALSSLLGEDYVLYPNRMIQAYGPPEQELTKPTGDQTWHKDQNYVPIRHHLPRWLLVFYYPATVTADQGPTAIMPGTAYTTIDHADPNLRFLTDTAEDHLATAATTASKAEALRRMHAVFCKDQVGEREIVFGEKISESEILPKLDEFSADDASLSGSVARLQAGRANSVLLDGLGGDVALRQAGEAAAMERMGCRMPSDPSDRAVFARADEPDTVGLVADQFQVFPQTAGTIVITHYDVLHRGTPRLPQSLWRPMVKLKAFRVSHPAMPTWAHVDDIPRPFTPGAEMHPVWERVWNWMCGSAASSSGGYDGDDSDSLRLFEIASSSSSDAERVGACYSLGAMARGGSKLALAKLGKLLVTTGRPQTQRAAMHGLASAGASAVPSLLAVVEASAEHASPDTPEQLNNCTRALFALGEAASDRQGGYRLNTGSEAIDTVERTLSRWLGRLGSAMKAPPTRIDGRISNWAAWHHAIAVCVQTVSLFCEQAAESDNELSLRLAQILLPLTLEPDPFSCAPEEAFQPAHNFWISEQAAIGLLRLASGTAGSGAESLGRAVKNSTHAEFSDQRTVQGLCLLALQRSKRCGKVRLAAMFAECADRWMELHDQAYKPHAFESTDASGGVPSVVLTEWHE